MQTFLPHLFRYLSVLLLALVLAGGASPVACFAASVAQAEAGLTPLIKDFDALRVDKVKGTQRHTWQNLESKFTRLALKSSGENKVQASYYAAQCLNELAKRSFAKSDYKAAASQYVKVAKSFPKNSLAAVCQYEAALITLKRLNNPEEADKLLAAALKSSPKGETAAKAAALRQEIAYGADKGKNKKTASAEAEDTPNLAKPGGSKASQSRIEQLGLAVKTVMIDPGHGGKDPGAEVPNQSERNLTLAMALILGDALKKNGFDVMYTRKTDTYLPLEKRTELVNASKADLFISIHANANPDHKLHGLETYFLAKAESTSAAKVAARENSVSEKQVNDVQFIVADLMLNSKLKESKAFAGMVHKGVLAQVKKGQFTLHDNGVRPAPFYVLMGARVPAILLEMGYMTHEGDLKLLNDRNFLIRQADGIVQGVKNYRDAVAKGID